MRDIRLERDGPVTFVVMARPERRNAVDGPMAAAELAEALREFESSDASVAVLAGDGPSFCADADLRAIGTEHANRVAPGGDGPMGRSADAAEALSHGLVGSRGASPRRDPHQAPD